MLDTARKASSKARHLTFEEFSADENLHLACLHLVQTIGEAAARVSAETRAQRADIPWRQITGMRHRIVRNYLDMDLEIVWQVITGDLPDLIADIARSDLRARRGSA